MRTIFLVSCALIVKFSFSQPASLIGRYQAGETYVNIITDSTLDFRIGYGGDLGIESIIYGFGNYTVRNDELCIKLTRLWQDEFCTNPINNITNPKELFFTLSCYSPKCLVGPYNFDKKGREKLRLKRKITMIFTVWPWRWHFNLVYEPIVISFFKT